MRRTLTFTNEALDDAIAARRWLTQQGAGVNAKLRLARINSALGDLVSSPCSWPRNDLPNTRSRVVEGYSILYRVIPDTGRKESAGDVTVLRIFGPGQDRSAL